MVEGIYVLILSVIHYRSVKGVLREIDVFTSLELKVIDGSEAFDWKSYQCQALKYSTVVPHLLDSLDGGTLPLEVGGINFNVFWYLHCDTMKKLSFLFFPPSFLVVK